MHAFPHLDLFPGLFLPEWAPHWSKCTNGVQTKRNILHLHDIHEFAWLLYSIHSIPDCMCTWKVAFIVDFSNFVRHPTTKTMQNLQMPSSIFVNINMRRKIMYTFLPYKVRPGRRYLFVRFSVIQHGIHHWKPTRENKTKHSESANAMPYFCNHQYETQDHAYFLALQSKAREEIPFFCNTTWTTRLKAYTGK
jgi:hypothetical protein